MWTEPGSAPYLGSLAYLRSNTVAEFGASLTRWGTPSVNHVCADVNGDIAWYTAGFTPRRNNWSGLLPVPGNGDYEWQGFLPAQDLPWAVNPDVGYIGTANEMNIPDGYAHPIGFEWADASRAQRIKSVLADDQNHTLTASMALQLDAYSEPASVICGLLRTASRPTDDTGGQEQVSPDGLSLLESWDHVLDADSAAGMLFEIWWMKHLRPALFSRFAASKHTIKLLPPGDTGHMLSLLSNPSPRWTNEERDALLYATLAPAYAECVKLLGPNSDVWQWGALHQVVFEHQLNRQLAHIAEPVDIGPFALGGSRSTPAFAGYRPNDFRVIAGATVRLVIDVGDWDNSICINTPGQSGDPQSPHYADLASLWANGDYVPLYFSQPRIDEETVQTLVLKPLKS